MKPPHNLPLRIFKLSPAILLVVMLLGVTATSIFAGDFYYCPLHKRSAPGGICPVANCPNNGGGGGGSSSGGSGGSSVGTELGNLLGDFIVKGLFGDPADEARQRAAAQELAIAQQQAAAAAAQRAQEAAAAAERKKQADFKRLRGMLKLDNSDGDSGGRLLLKGTDVESGGGLARDSAGKLALKLGDDEDNLPLKRAGSAGGLALKLGDDDDDLKPHGTRASANSGPADAAAPNTDPMVVDLRGTTKTSIDPALLKNDLATTATSAEPLADEVLRDAVADTPKGKAAVVPVNEEARGYLEQRLLDQLSKATTPEEKAALEVKYAHLLLGKADKQGASAAWQRAMKYNSSAAIQAEHNFQAVMQQPVSPAQDSAPSLVPLTPFDPNRNAKVPEGSDEAAKAKSGEHFGENPFGKQRPPPPHWQEPPALDTRIDLAKHPELKQNLAKREALVATFRAADPKDPNKQADIQKQVERIDKETEKKAEEIIKIDYPAAANVDP